MKESKKIPGTVTIYACIGYSSDDPTYKEESEKERLQIDPCVKYVKQNKIPKWAYNVASEYYYPSHNDKKCSYLDSSLSFLDEKISEDKDYKYFFIVSSRSSLSPNKRRANKFIKDFSARGSEVIIIDEL